MRAYQKKRNGSSRIPISDVTKGARVIRHERPLTVKSVRPGWSDGMTFLSYCCGSWSCLDSGTMVEIAP